MEDPVSARLVGECLDPREPVVRRAGEGDEVDALGVVLRWKARGAETGFAFSMAEIALEPGTGIPLHMHPFAETFHVLEGRLDVTHTGRDGTPRRVTVDAGDSATAPINTPHACSNGTGATVRFLSVSSYGHERIFDDYVAGLVRLGTPDPTEAERLEAFSSAARTAQAAFVSTEPEA